MMLTPSTEAIHRRYAGHSPFSLRDVDSYLRWRDWKLECAPTSVSDLIVEVRDLGRLTPVEHGAIADRCRQANMAIYASADERDDNALPRRLAAQFGLRRLDANWLADDDGVSRLEVGESTGRGEFIPYTDRPIRWHPDGYYNPPSRQIRSMVLHCVRDAADGGDNALLDHEMAYILLRDENPEFVAALSAPDAMRIPCREDANGTARAEETGPVFHVDPEDGQLHMRYTARTTSIEWKNDALTQAAVRRLAEMLDAPLPWILRARLEPGSGLICNNVLHTRNGFRDDPSRPRLLFRARYLDRVASPQQRP